jgi:hypothetical protein
MYLYSRNVAGGVTTSSEQWQLLGHTAGTPLSDSLFGSALALSDSTMEIVIGGQLEHTPGSRTATHTTGRIHQCFALAVSAHAHNPIRLFLALYLLSHFVLSLQRSVNLPWRALCTPGSRVPPAKPVLQVLTVRIPSRNSSAPWVRIALQAVRRRVPVLLAASVQLPPSVSPVPLVATASVARRCAPLALQAHTVR